MSVVAGALIDVLLRRVLQQPAPGANAAQSAQHSQSAPQIDPAMLEALISAAAQRPAEPLPEIKLPRSASVVATIVIIGFFALLAAIAGLLALGHGEFGAALAVLCVGFGVCASKFGTVVDFLFGSSWGSRQKDARPPAEPASPPIFLPPPVAPVEPEPQPAPPVEPGTWTSTTTTETPVPRPDEDERFLACAQIIDKWEGGYSNDPQDAGGPTNHGITQAVLSEWIGRPASVADVKALSLDTAHQIFRKRYWDPLRCGELPAGLALMTYNTGVNSGISRGAKFLQRTLGIAEDGVVGPETIAAANSVDQVKAVNEYSATYEAFYRSLSNYPTFGRGWLNRLRDVTASALALAHADASQTARPAPSAPPADLAASIVAAMRRKEYVLDTKPGEVNVVYVEGLNEDGTVNDDASDEWNDLRVVIGFDEERPLVLGKWVATTEPGRYYTDDPLKPAGAARIEFGQYTAWKVGVHRGDHPALVQRGPVTVCRDANRDMLRTGDVRDTGNGFGINQHGPTGVDAAPNTVGKFSAGCLVGKTMAGHRAFMAIVQTDPRFLADPEFIFTATILAEKDVV